LSFQLKKRLHRKFLRNFCIDKFLHFLALIIKLIISIIDKSASKGEFARCQQGDFMKKVINIKETIKQHIINNKREYIIVSLFFIIGIFFGVLFVNNIKEEQKEQIGTYVNDYITKMKDTDNINNIDVLESSIKQNLLITLGIWFFGTTVIRVAYSFWNCFI